jgi:hypothetical protein
MAETVRPQVPLVVDRRPDRRVGPPLIAATPQELLVRFAYSLTLPVVGIATAAVGSRGLDAWLSLLLLGWGTLLALLALRRLRM